MPTDKTDLASSGGNSNTDSSVQIHFDNSYFNELSGFYQSQDAELAPSPSLIKFNYALARSLNIDAQSANDEQLANIFSGNQKLEGSNAISSSLCWSPIWSL